MKSLGLFLLLTLFLPHAFAGPVPLHPSHSEIISIITCEMCGILYKIAGELRDQKVEPSQATQKIKKLAKKYPHVAANIVRDVYGKYKDKSPEWLEGFFYGLCLSGIPAPNPYEDEYSIPRKNKRNMM